MFNKELIHYGPVFKIKYEYKGIDKDLTPEQEEGLILFIRFIKQYNYSIDNDKRVFNNFFESSGISEKVYLKNLEKFEPYAKTYKKTYEQSKDICIIDGQEYKVSGQRIPYGIFFGRGDNKNNGKLRKYIQPSDVTINSTQKIEVPKQFNGQTWQQWITDKTSLFLASWKDDVTNKINYMRPDRSATITQSHNMEKFELARKLHKNRVNIYQKLKQDPEIYLCIYLVSDFGIRIGSHDLDNGVQGASQLNLSNISIIQKKDKYYIRLQFKGKDSIQFDQTHICEDEFALSILQDKIKLGGKELFKVSGQKINDYLDNIMPGLSAKVFRTYKSSLLLYQQLQNDKQQSTSDIMLQKLKLHLFKVAEFCNHVKTSKTTKPDKIKEKITKLKNMLKEKKNLTTEQKEKIKLKIESLLLKMQLNESKQSLNIQTSLQNYIDPRIVLQYCNKYNIDALKIYNQTTYKTIQWAVQLDNSEFVY